MEFDIALFIGRFHPLLVHLPIGIIILALVLEILPQTSTRIKRIVWFLSFTVSLLSIISGLQIASTSSYPVDTLWRHKWLGLSICTLSFFIWAFGNNLFLIRNKIMVGAKWILFIVLLLGGHMGGQLTHGNEYLTEAAPLFLKKALGIKEVKSIDLSNVHSDSIYTYEHLIDPFIQVKCVKCHNTKNANGDLDLSNKEGLIAGGTNGPVIIPNDDIESEIFKRVTLDQSNKKFMPTKGLPLNYKEMELLRWWINNGSKFEERTSSTIIPNEIVRIIQEKYNVDLSSRPWYEKELGPEIDSTLTSDLEVSGFNVLRNSSNDNFLHLSTEKNSVAGEFPFEENHNVIILDLKNKEINEDFYPEISKLKNLIRLQLNGTETNSEMLMKIKVLERLESINMYGTKLDDNGLLYLAQFPMLKRIYAWQTNVTSEGVHALGELRSDIEVNTGSNK